MGGMTERQNYTFPQRPLGGTPSGKKNVFSNRFTHQPAGPLVPPPANGWLLPNRKWRVYLGQHGQMLVLDDGGPVGRQAAFFQTWEQVVQMHAGDTEKKELVTHLQLKFCRGCL